MVREDNVFAAVEEVRSAWKRFTQTASDRWDEAKNTIRFGENQIPRDQLIRILFTASKLASNAYDWEFASERRRHSVQLRRLSVLSANMEALSRLVAGDEVSVSEGDILSIVDDGVGEDTNAQRMAPRADIEASPIFYHDEGEKHAVKLAEVYQKLRHLLDTTIFVDSDDRVSNGIAIRQQIEQILDHIRNGN